MKLKNPLFFAASLAALMTAQAAHAQSKPAWKSYQVTGNPADMVKSTTVADWLALKTDVANGTLTNPTITDGTATGLALSAPSITGGSVTNASVTASSLIANSFSLIDNPSLEACPVGSCPNKTSTYGTVMSSGIMQGETQIESGRGETILNVGLLVDKGATGGASTYGKLPLYVGMMQAKGGGTAWAYNTNAIRNAIPGGDNSFNGLPGSGTPGDRGAMGSVSTIGYENDLTNWDEDAATSNAFVTLYYGHMQGSYASTAYFNLDASMPTGIFGAHYGEYWQKNSVQDIIWYENTAATTGTLYTGDHSNAAIEDDGAGSASLYVKGKKTVASILDQSNSASVLQASGTYTNATITDQSTSPTAINLNGTYSLAAVVDSMPSTGNVAFISVKPQHKICFNGQSSCMYYDETSKKIYATNTSGSIIWSVDDSGNAIFKGTVTTGSP